MSSNLIKPLQFIANGSQAYQNPVILEESKSFSAPVDIFSRLMKERIIFLGDDITSEVANIIASQLIYLNFLARQDDFEGSPDITIYINCRGGIVSDGLVIYDTIKSLSCDVRTVCIGQASSMAAVLLSAGTKGKRLILPNAKVLIHQPWGAVSGTVDEMEIQLNEMKKDKEKLYQLISQNIDKPYEQIKDDSKLDFWLNSEEALAYGIIDQIVGTI